MAGHDIAEGRRWSVFRDTHGTCSPVARAATAGDAALKLGGCLANVGFKPVAAGWLFPQAGAAAVVARVLGRLGAVFLKSGTYG
jgi:hypothetical protein